MTTQVTTIKASQVQRLNNILIDNDIFKVVSTRLKHSNSEEANFRQLNKIYHTTDLTVFTEYIHLYMYDGEDKPCSIYLLPDTPVTIITQSS